MRAGHAEEARSQAQAALNLATTTPHRRGYQRRTSSFLRLHLGVEVAGDARALGLCKPPIAAGQGSGGRRFSIVPGEPEASILLHRLASTAPGERMPELGRALSHKEGVELVREWIDTMPGACETIPPTPG